MKDMSFSVRIIALLIRNIIQACFLKSCGARYFDLTAEGIENEEQLQFVTEQGCHIGQGYIFDKPLSPEEMSRLLN
ncbi:hypothetical protein CIB87_17580 [Priestia megaterium]|uniref:EAL domain-containing protein n=1 Tax=Priestia megaterium TaxID=1404 RepID=A0AA86IHY3_PRIMG|nr:hypothetical protein CIB87_17580 [Priestia megaterium]